MKMKGTFIFTHEQPKTQQRRIATLYVTYGHLMTPVELGLENESTALYKVGLTKVEESLKTSQV